MIKLQLTARRSTLGALHLSKLFLHPKLLVSQPKLVEARRHQGLLRMERLLLSTFPQAEHLEFTVTDSKLTFQLFDLCFGLLGGRTRGALALEGVQFRFQSGKLDGILDLLILQGSEFRGLHLQCRLRPRGTLLLDQQPLQHVVLPPICRHDVAHRGLGRGRRQQRRTGLEGQCSAVAAAASAGARGGCRAAVAATRAQRPDLLCEAALQLLAPGQLLLQQNQLPLRLLALPRRGRGVLPGPGQRALHVLGAAAAAAGLREEIVDLDAKLLILAAQRVPLLDLLLAQLQLIGQLLGVGRLHAREAQLFSQALQLQVQVSETFRGAGCFLLHPALVEHPRLLPDALPGLLRQLPLRLRLPLCFFGLAPALPLGLEVLPESRELLLAPLLLLHDGNVLVLQAPEALIDVQTDLREVEPLPGHVAHRRGPWGWRKGARRE
mmetsp:Transcript_10274/g.26566  ORF Transcript_10274/g.26566 Transcript_10274/m.26566 type:complete len:437 (-) Transcript_10274:407-1717(-)